MLHTEKVSLCHTPWCDIIYERTPIFLKAPNLTQWQLPFSLLERRKEATSCEQRLDLETFSVTSSHGSMLIY